MMRVGFDNPVGPILGSIGLSLFIIGFPYLASLAADAYGSEITKRWYGSYGFLWLVGIGVTAVLGSLAGLGLPSALPILALTGASAFLIALVRWIRLSKPVTAAAALTGFALFGGWAAGVVWGRIYKSPVLLEMLIADGKIHHDGLGLSALAGMLRTYGTASTGIDGLPPMHYHWGSPWLFAQWANLVRTPVIDFYQLGYPVTVLPFFFGAVFALAITGRRQNNPASPVILDWRSWAVLVFGAIGFIPLAGMDALGVWTSNYMISESYAVGVGCALLVAATVIVFQRQQGHHIGVAQWTFALVFIPAALVVLGYLKISLMILGYGVGAFFLLRLPQYRTRLFFMSAALATVAVVLTYRQVSLPEHHEGLALFDFLSLYVPRPWWPFFPLLHLFWTWVYALVRARQERISTLGDIGEAVRQRRMVDVEVLVLLACAGLLPGLLLHIDGGSAFYFSDVQRWVALSLLISVASVAIPRFRGQSEAGVVSTRTGYGNASARSVFLVLLLIPITVVVVQNASYWPIRMIRANAELRRSLYPPAVAAKMPAGVHGFPYLQNAAVLRDGLHRSLRYPVVNALRDVYRMPPAERRRTAVFIAQDDAEYWTILSRPGACSFQSLVAPALTETAMIGGTPPVGCSVSRYYGMGSYELRRQPQPASDTTDIALCDRARRWNLSKVLVFRFDSKSPIHRRLITCAAT